MTIRRITIIIMRLFTSTYSTKGPFAIADSATMLAAKAANSEAIVRRTWTLTGLILNAETSNKSRATTLNSRHLNEIYRLNIFRSAKYSADKTARGISVEVGELGRSVTLIDADDVRSWFDATFLLLNCHCACCKQEHSGQKTIDLGSIPNPAFVESATIGGSSLKLVYKVPQHKAVVPLVLLRKNSDGGRQRRFVRPQKFISQNNIPTVSYKELEREERVFYWLKIINEYGLCVVRGVPIEVEMVKKVGELIAPIQRTIYDEIFDVKVEEKPINAAYSNVKLDYHADLSYYESPPGLQFLHCIK